MNKYTKFLALMSFALVMSACQDDNIISVAPALPGDDIVFGATGYLESGDKGTRTIYGDVYEDLYGKHIQVKWVKGTDRMDIACPQSATAGNVKIAEYKVMDESNSVVKDTLDLDEEIDSIRIEDSSVTATLHRLGNAGLQWSAEDTHHFFASYPSKAMIAEKLETTLSQEEIKELGMTLDGEANAKLRGYLPVNQTPSNVPTTPNAERDGNQGYVIAPDMTYAYMVANNTVETKGNVGLLFTSQMTALEFEIVASDIEQIPNEPTITHEIKILGVTLSHARKEQIAGHFEYDYAENFFSNVEIEGTDAHTSVTQMFPEGLLVDAETGFVDVTFFVFPGVTFNDGNDEAAEEDLAKELELTVLYQIDGIHQNRTAKIRKQIEPKKKYFFANVKLPKIQANAVSASNWFDALDDQILVSQVSIPVASNVFANPSYVDDIDAHTTQQTKTLEELWNLGVRGFELCNQTSTDKNEGSASVQSESLDSEGMVASETVSEKMTFEKAIDALYASFKNSNEPLILVCTYASCSDGYNPYHYVCNLFNSLESFCKRHSIERSTFVQITSSTTTADIKGKIAVVIRPGDDERWLYETGVHDSNKYNEGITTDPYAMLGNSVPTTPNSPYGLTKYMRDAKTYTEKRSSGTGHLYNNEWWNRVLMVSDWGVSSWDNWHRRGPSLYYYASTATNYDAIVSASRTPISSLQNKGGKYEDGIVNNSPIELTNTFHYAHDMSNGATAYIQDFVRVIDQDVTSKALTLHYKGSILDRDKTTSATVSWKESLIEKKTAIDGLFKKSVATKGNSSSRDLYINVLSSYYPTDEYFYEYDYEGGLVSYFPSYDSKTFKKAGRGGNYQSAASALTTHTYNLLSAKQNITGETAKLNEGPWGLVMMDYIGDDTKNPSARNLVNLIMLNNFKFPLAKGDGTGTGGTGGTGGNGGTD